MTPEAVASYAYGAGFRGDPLVVAVAIAGAESTWNNLAYNDTPPDLSYGLWQINMYGSLGPDRRTRYRLDDNGDLYNPAINAAAAYDISTGGTNFGPWSTFGNGAYRRFLDQARAAAITVESRGGSPGDITATTEGFPGPALASTPGAPTADYLPDALKLQPPSSSWRPSRFIDGFKIQGRFIEGDILGAAATSGHIDLTTDQVSQVDIVFPDPRGFGIAERFPLRTDAAWYDLPLRVADKKWGPGSGGSLEQLTVSCRSDGAERMREYDALGRSIVFTNMSPTELMNERALVSGLLFVGKGSVRRPQITRHGKGDTQQDQSESDWDLGQRLAKEEGFWAFESSGVYYFAPPSWLVSKMPRFAVQWSPGAAVPAGVVEPLGCPDADISSDEKPGQVDVRTLSLQLPREVGEQVRPGMAIDFAGIPGWEAGGGFDGRYLVTRVSWDLNGGITPASVEATQPVDPVPEPPSTEEVEDTSPTGAPRFTNTPLTGGPSALDFVTVALGQVGKPYDYGAEADPNDADPSAFDCSELVQWAAARVGVDFVDGSYAQLAGVERITVDQARLIRGALLFPQPDAHHVAISLGDGAHTVEAKGRAYGVVQGDIGSRFGAAGLIPGLDYGVVR